jgi:hypothetical protein
MSNRRIGSTRYVPPRYTPPAPGIRSASLRAAPIDAVYLAQLARDLLDVANAGADPTKLRRLRQRLREWLEDVRSVGADHTGHVAAVDALVTALSACIDRNVDLANVAQKTAAALGELAAGHAAAPPAAMTTAARSRLKFWK